MAYLVIALCFGLAGGIVGRIKGSSFLVWFLISGAIPFVGLLAAILYRYESEEPMRACPRCRRIARVSDAICMNCGEELEYPSDTEIVWPDPERRVKARL